MPEYLAPGVYVEELPSNPHPIEGVPTSTVGFVGASHIGPTDSAVGPITSLVEFEQQFGDRSVMDFEELPPTPCFLFAAVRAFFGEGGRRLWIARIKRAGSGADGARPQADDFERGLNALDAVQEVTIIAAPGATYGAGGTFADDAREISARLIAHADATGNRFAILDCPDGADVAKALEWRAAFSTNFAALYFPWISLANNALMPPAGTVAGVFARVDTARGVWHAPANEVVQATAVELSIDQVQQDLLNANGINSIRAFPGQGIRIWGARTLSGESDWRYVNVRRLFLYIEQSLYRGLQWAVDETNDETLWLTVRFSVADFLDAQFRQGAFQGVRPDDAYFVKCDRSTMTQEDIDRGRLVCLVGAAPVRPAEFIILRVTVQTSG